MPTWFRVDAGFPGHPKVAHLAHLAGIDRDTAIAVLIRLWDWCTRYAPDGRLIDENLASAREAVSISSKPDLDLIDLLTQARWLDKDRWGYAVHDFNQRNGRHFREAERKQAERDRRRAPSADTARSRPGQSLPTDGRTGRDGTDGENYPDVVAGRTELLDGGEDPAGLPAAAFSAITWTAVQEAFPDHDVPLIARKLLAKRPGNLTTVAHRDQALWRWCESAREKQTELKLTTPTPAEDRKRLEELQSRRRRA